MKEFKVGDLVYFPSQSTKVLQVVKSDISRNLGVYPLMVMIDDDIFTFINDGRWRIDTKQPALFHATPENHALLERLYGVEFEKPPVKPTSREIIQAMLKRGDKCVPCWVSDDYEPPLPFNVCVLITELANDEFRTHAGVLWEYATPFDPKTGEPITELPT